MTFVEEIEENPAYSATVELYLRQQVRNLDRRSKEAYHVWIVRVYTHVREWVETSHSSESQMTVQLRERVVRVLTSLHLRQGLRRSGSGG